MSGTDILFYETVENDFILRLLAIGAVQATPPSDTFVVSGLKLTVLQMTSGKLAQADFSIDETRSINFSVPLKILRLDSNVYRLLKADELGDLAHEEWAALKARMRQRLAEPMLIAPNTGLFGVKQVLSANIEGRVWLNPALVDGPASVDAEDWLLKALAEADITLDYTNGMTGGVGFAGRFVAAFRVNKSAFQDWVTADFGFDLPTLPGFDLKLPQIKFPDLAFPSLEPFPDVALSLFDLSLPPMIGQLSFAWTSKPQLQIALTNGDLSISTDQPGSGVVSVAGQDWVRIHDLTLSGANGKFDFNAEIDADSPPITLPDFDIADEKRLPFKLTLTDNTIVPRISDLNVRGQVLRNADLSFTFESKRIEISDVKDPSLNIVLTLALTTGYDLASGKTTTSITNLKIIEPYPIELIKRVGSALGELIRIGAAIPLPSANISGVDPSGVLRLLQRIGDMLASAARWLAGQAGKAAAALAGLAEAVFDLLMQLVKALGEAGKTIISHIAIEIRLDPKTYRLRQIVIMPAGDDSALNETLKLSVLGFDFSLDAKLRPALMVDFGQDSWFGLVVQAANGANATLATDLWLDRETGPQQTMGSFDENGVADGTRLVELTVSPVPPTGGTSVCDIVLIALQNGQPKLFQTYSPSPTGQAYEERIDFGGKVAVALREAGSLRDARIDYNGKIFPKDTTADLALSLNAKNLNRRLLSLLGKADDTPQANTFFDTLKQKVEVKGAEYELVAPDTVTQPWSIKVKIPVIIHIEKDFTPETTISVTASLPNLSMKITGGDRIDILSKDENAIEYRPLGLNLLVSPAKELKLGDRYKQFYIDLSHGGESMGLGPEAKALLSYGKVSTSGKGLQFEVPVFRIGRGGFDLDAKILPDPVVLGGVDVPFRFTSGQVSIKGSKFKGGALAGTGQLPQQLVGEANASIALQLAAGEGGGVIVKGATAKLDKSGDPIRCSATRFELTITELGFDFVESGGYHFYFMLTGTAVFRPGGSEFANGLLKNFKDITIKLDKAPLAADPRVLLNSISFQVKVDPPKRMSFFDIFDFELRGFGFHPASPKFDGDAAMSISGQVNFTKGADKVSRRCDFHSMWIAPPKSGSAMPRVRFDGLTVGIKTGSVDVEGTAIAVDGNMPDLYRPGVLPANVTAEGFLASGRLDIEGWSSMSAAMGFLELRRKDVPSDPRHSFFLYGQSEKLAEPIDTPVGRIYLREYGFGFGYRYTLAGIAQAETAKSPQELVRILDQVSKYQGSLNSFKAWEPTYDNDDLTLALRGMFALSAANEGGPYDAEKEANLPNPLLFDIVAAFRTDLTFLINLRAWVSVNYNDWTSSGSDVQWKSNPTMRGYLYFSVPRKEFLGRFISDGTGYVGEHPKLPEPLITAIRSTQFSATLYIRPGLFHAELGWPYELGFKLGKPEDTLYLDLKGGLIHRIEDLSVLNGIAFKANGAVNLEGHIGGSSLGASAVARANFSLEARVLSYLSLKNAGESFLYGYMRIDVTIGVSVKVWVSFKIFGGSITLSASFSLSLALSIALEAVIGPNLIGGRAHVSIGVRAFGRSLSVAIGLAYRDDNLAMARAKVARFMDLGLAAPIPNQSQDGQRVERNPRPSPSPSETAVQGDSAIEEEVAGAPLPVTAEEEEQNYPGRPIDASDFWAFLFPTRAPDLKSADQNWYVMQIVPRDHTVLESDMDNRLDRATFFASPMTPDKSSGFDAPGHRLDFGAVRDDADAYLAAIDGQSEKRIGIIPASVAISRIVLDAVVGKNASQTLYLGKLLQAVFLGEPDVNPENFGGKLEEPSARVIDTALIDLHSDPKIAAKQLARAGRSRADLGGKEKREAEIEEIRSSILSAVIETASIIADAGAQNNLWPERRPEIDARDFGLTFLVNEKAICVLFDGDASAAPPLANFTIRKSDGPTSDGKVHLFNHPARMFRKAQPKLAPAHRIDTQGIKLNWDLEPAWGRSTGVYNDPEFHLKHYRIRRTIRGLGGNEYQANFAAKGVAPTRRVPDGHGGFKISFLRPDFQFVDDLRNQDAGSGLTGAPIPEDLRKLLLNEQTDKGWNESQFRDLDLSSINVLYEIVPVDNAGTSDFGQTYVVDGFSLIQTLPISPREVTLQVAYDAMPTHVPSDKETAFAVKPPRLVFLMKPSTDDNLLQKQAFLLRIWPQAIAPSGSYGSDAVDEARKRPDQDAIEQPRAGAQDFILTVTKKVDLKDATFIAEYPPASPTEPPGYISRKFELYKASGGEHKLEEVTDPTALWQAIGASDTPNAERIGYRLFMATIARKGQMVDETKRGEWKTLAFNLAIDKAGEHENETLTAISSVVEILEQPVHYEFKPVKRRDMRAKSGRLIIVQPTKQGNLSELGKDGFSGLRDALRRTASRLEWNANPASLALTGDPSVAVDSNAIAGFDLFSLDPDVLPGSAGSLIEEVVQNARPLGRASLLAPELNGLDPSGFGDFGRLESAYPSDTLRMKHAGSGRKASWYSAAETTAIFPEPVIRRSIMADPDEALIAGLFSGGKPDSVRVSIPDWLTASPLSGWIIDDVGVGGWGETEQTKVEGERGPFEVTFSHQGGFSVPVLRQLLQNLRLTPLDDNRQDSPARISEASALARRVAEAGYLSSVGVSIEALRKKTAKQADSSTVETLVSVAKEAHSFDLIPMLHPVLGDTLAFLQYDSQDDGGLGAANGKIYRRFALAPDNNPESTAESFSSYLDEAPPERDPYGWGSLRVLGLASGFRLFDTETGDYVRFNQSGLTLADRIDLALKRALSRYPQRDLGQAFVDVLTQPWGNAELAWFDGGHRDIAITEEVNRIKDEMLAVVQIALRPHPDRVVANSSDLSDQEDEKWESCKRIVRYYALTVDAPEPSQDGVWRLTQVEGFAEAFYDVLTLNKTLISQKPVRLTQKEPTIEFYERRPALPWPPVKDGEMPRTDRTIVALVRMTQRTKDRTRQPGLTISDPYETLEPHWEEIIHPAVLDALDKEDGYFEDFAFGRFENLSGADWGDALFRPSEKGKVVNSCVAIKRLSHYAARRFGPLVIPVAVNTDPSQTEQDEFASRRGELAYRIVQFWTRFVDHCAPGWGWRLIHGKLSDSPDNIFFSLGTVADPGQWRRAPGRAGTVSVTIVDADRRGARRKFAIRPYGRYEAWSQAAPSKIGNFKSSEQRFERLVPSGLDGAFIKKEAASLGRMYFVDTTLPRTEPLEKPVILSTVTEQGSGGEPGRMELVVAHGSDMVLAQANRRNAALLAPLDLSVGYWREFPHEAWAGVLATRHDLSPNAMQPFGSLRQRLDQKQLTIAHAQVSQQLVGLRQRVPDAWLGSTVISARSLPYFFRVHALVHAAAGVVVSEQVAATFEEGFYRLEWPDTPWPKPVWPGRTLSDGHRYVVERRPVKGEDREITVITFDIAALRFIDCMYPEDARLWFGENEEYWQQDLKIAVHLPEPGVSYRIAIETPFTIVANQPEEILSRIAEIEVIPKPPQPGTRDKLYLLQQSGNRLTPKVAVDASGDPLGGTVFSTDPMTDATGLSWRIPVVVQLSKEPGPLMRAIPQSLADPLKAAAPSEFGRRAPNQPPAIAALVETTIRWAPQADMAIVDAAKAALVKANAPETVSTLEAMASAFGQSGMLTLLVSIEASKDAEVLRTLTDLMGGTTPTFSDVKFVILRRPPTNQEIDQFDLGNGIDAQFTAWISTLAEEQLFGFGRRPSVLAFKGANAPIASTFER
ncbi:hypothetical protein ACCS62_28470 [Rhizobium ruizarguesonis]